MTTPSITVIVTAYNEGPELTCTLRSVVDKTNSLAEVIVVDDGSEDGSCGDLAGLGVKVIRHDRRVGVAYSRHEGSQLAGGNVLCFLDAHQRVGKGCLDRCAQVALARDAITCPDLKGYGWFAWRLQGATFALCAKRGYFTAKWRTLRWRRRVSRITALRAPPYLVPRSVYPQVAWSTSLAGWGASEASITLKSFFTALPILHVGGPLARHLFRRKFPYETTWDGVWRNQAIVARVCFDDATWFDYWLPRVFESYLNDETRTLLGSAELLAEHEEFQARKVRTDREFWTELLRTRPPKGIE